MEEPDAELTTTMTLWCNKVECVPYVAMIRLRSMLTMIT